MQTLHNKNAGPRAEQIRIPLRWPKTNCDSAAQLTNSRPDEFIDFCEEKPHVRSSSESSAYFIPLEFLRFLRSWSLRLFLSNSPSWIQFPLAERAKDENERANSQKTPTSNARPRQRRRLSIRQSLPFKSHKNITQHEQQHRKTA